MPQLGSGILTGAYQPYRGEAALYFATYNATSLAAVPSAKLGSGVPATGTWSNIGLLQNDDFTVNTTEASFIEDRRGFKRVLYGRAINQAGSAAFETMIVESDPETINRITGDTLTNIGASVGKSIKVTYDALYDRTVMLYCLNAFDTSQERAIYIPHAQCRLALERADEVWALKVTIEALQYVASGVSWNFEEYRYN